MDGNGGRMEKTAPERPTGAGAGAESPASPQRIAVIVRPGAGRRAWEVLRWLRWLVPAAVLLVTPVPLPPGDASVSIDVEEVASGPLSLADALLRDRGDVER